MLLEFERESGTGIEQQEGGSSLSTQAIRTCRGPSSTADGKEVQALLVMSRHLRQLATSFTRGKAWSRDQRRAIGRKHAPARRRCSRTPRAGRAGSLRRCTRARASRSRPPFLDTARGRGPREGLRPRGARPITLPAATGDEGLCYRILRTILSAMLAPLGRQR